MQGVNQNSWWNVCRMTKLLRDMGIEKGDTVPYHPFIALLPAPEKVTSHISVKTLYLDRWNRHVEEQIEASELKRLRLHIQRERPYSDVAGTAKAIMRMGMEWPMETAAGPGANARRSRKQAGESMFNVQSTCEMWDVPFSARH